MPTDVSPTRTRNTLAGTLAAAAILLAACSGSTDEAATAPETTGSGEATSEEPQAVASPEAEPAEDSQQTPPDDADAAQAAEPTTAAEPPPDDAPQGDEADSEANPGQTDDATLDGVITDIVADATGGRSTFDGTVDEISDLEALVVDAWGDGGLGLHRGHAQVENVLAAFLGIEHDDMHAYMDDGYNLAELAVAMGGTPEALVATLTASYVPYVDEGVANGVITADEADQWTEQIRAAFDGRVHWDGVSER